MAVKSSEDWLFEALDNEGWIPDYMRAAVRRWIQQAVREAAEDERRRIVGHIQDSVGWIGPGSVELLLKVIDQNTPK